MTEIGITCEGGITSDPYETPKEVCELEEDTDSIERKKRKVPDSSSVLCPICEQNVVDPKTKFFKGFPVEAMEEEAALTDARLQLYSEGELIPEIDSKPQHKVTHFTVFDTEGHLCPFDTGLIENDKLIYFSGYLKPIYDDDPSPENGVPAQELGPILEWWISGFDGGNSFLLGFTTPYADYILMEPSSDYKSFMRLPKQKALLSKIVIEFLSDSLKPGYDELLGRISEVSVPDDIEPFDELSIGKNAQFIVDQVREVDVNKKFISTPAIQEIIKTYNVNIKKVNSGRKSYCLKNIIKPTTTPLVRRHFEFFLNNNDCCINKIRDNFLCPDSKKLSKFSWEEGSNYAVVNDELIYVGDFVYINTNLVEKQNRIFRIKKFFQQNFTKKAHCTELIKASDTILAEASDPAEFFFLEECGDWPICKIISKVNIIIKGPPKNWPEFISYQPESYGQTFFVQKKYSPKYCVFEDFEDSLDILCYVCRNKSEKEKEEIPLLGNGITGDSGVTTFERVFWKNEDFRPGTCVFLEPFSVVFNAQKSSLRIERTLVTIKTNEVIYPEIYRKAKEVNLIEECPEPFVVAYIKKIYTRNEGFQKKLFLTVNKFYRPENTQVIKTSDKRLSDVQLLYWSEEETEVLFNHVRGKCDVRFSKTPPDVGLNTQFYFHSGFDFEKKTFYDVEDIVIHNKEREECVVKKLKTMNVFSGCGGLAEGLRQSGVADIVWAIEIDKSTSETFRSNFPNVSMFEKDCNLFLKEVITGVLTDENKNLYPAKGDVEFLCGGPPCQGFSLMNRFSSKEDSQHNNSLIATCLSFCDYYRPKFFLLENVKNFIYHKKSSFLKHSLSCLVAMGYQCTFGILQAGNYGVPQFRKRLFILAAAPGESLPNFPKPSHVFYGSIKNLEYEVMGKNYSPRFSKSVSGSAPYRKITIRDAVFDLRSVSKDSAGMGVSRELTYYVKFLKGCSGKITDHISKEVTPLNQSRIKHIPASKGCDWRDLPNIRVRLSDGTLTELLKYGHNDRKNGLSCCGLPRGVCSCASGQTCDPAYRQTNTLIPWFLVHTANRNNNWSGLYGRLDWDGAFNTVTTNPEPSSQQGKVLHPEEDRIISIRECARAQGLPDSFILCGTMSDKYKQVGNAVPPPVARALGCEIKKCLILSEKKQRKKCLNHSEI